MGSNAAWMETSMAAADLLAWTQTMLLDGELAKAEPKKLRYRLLHTAARITRGQRRIHLRRCLARLGRGVRREPLTPGLLITVHITSD
jgi:hypothetical protein